MVDLDVVPDTNGPRNPSTVEPKPANGSPPQEPKSASENPPFECGVLIYLPAGGLPVMGDLNFPEHVHDVKVMRKATFDDMYRMVCDLKAILESMRTTSHAFRVYNESMQMAAAAGKRVKVIGPDGQPIVP